MSFTYATLTSAIQNFAEYDETDYVADIPTFIRNAEERIFRAIELPCARKTATGTMTIGDDTITHSITDLYWPHYFAITVAGAKIPLLPKEPDWLVEAYGGNTSGQPIYYAMNNELEFFVAPKPSSAFTWEVVYHGLPTSIVDGTTSWLGTNARNALLYGSLVEGAIYMRQDQDVLQAYETHFQEAMGQLSEQGQFRLRKDNFRSRDKRPVDGQATH